MVLPLAALGRAFVHGRIEWRVGIAGVLELLSELAVPATFFVPGWTAFAHRAACEVILRAGHEIGPHGHLHRRPERDDFDPAREGIDRCFEALQRAFGGGAPAPVEIPVNTALDDWNVVMTRRVDPRPLFGREAVLSLWIDEFEATHAWGGVTTLKPHPQVSGRPMRWHLLRDFLRHVRGEGDVWIATGAEINACFEACRAEEARAHAAEEH